jgi:hypothetical protein
VARITGLDDTYRFAREFLVATTRPLRVSSEDSPQTRNIYTLDDGLYECQVVNDRQYFAVVNNRRMMLSTDDVATVERMCKQTNVPITAVFNCWAHSRGRSSESFAAMACEMTAEGRAQLRQRRRAEAVQRRNRVAEMTAVGAYYGSDAADTRAFLIRLESAGPSGPLAVDLFRAQKASTRAKKYRGASKGRAYDRKGKALCRLCATLATTADVRWGWRPDPKQFYAPWVLYVDLPNGQVSFHSLDRGEGPDYPAEWDGQHASEQRILDYCEQVLHGSQTVTEATLIGME